MKKPKKRSLNIRTHIFMPEETGTLKKYRDGPKDFRLRLRFIALLLIAGNTGIPTVASSVGKDVRTVETWYEKYLASGPDALNSFQYKAKQCFLSDDQLADTVAWVRRELPSDTKVIGHHIKKKTGVAYSRSAIEKLLKKKGLRWLRPKLIPGKPPSEEKQTDFIENIKNFASPPPILNQAGLLFSVMPCISFIRPCPRCVGEIRPNDLCLNQIQGVSA
ncbi:hypothetical protein DENIS_2754 [Desulfonema ishimotonii]|uniref:Winged helix-turn helix domain-containing protein n=1 Tax=Desulfonema ishimotonii TaxID=45657 RepID=A0A401FXQ6_9BACT|nr:winged helix-turn-helix domain-containing protein [Desulfonema ishimotonii]GBC61792.1 hypothetical protein DENIS_2754 [Desulfonema ishimotonii]